MTNGIKYRFFTDLDETNKMDQKPFFEIDLFNLNDIQISYLKNFERESLDVNSILSTAEELKYSNLIKDFLKQQLASPSEDFANYILSHIYEGRKTANVVEKFLPIVKRAFNQLITETLSTKFAETLKGDSKFNDSDITQENIPSSDVDTNINKIITTADELEGFAIIKSILRTVINPNDITYKDTESYFGILYKNNTRKWICRLYLGSKKSIVLPADDKGQERYYIETLDDLYIYEDQLKSVVEKLV